MTFQPGNNLGGRTKGAKNKVTLDKEKRRVLFDELVSDRFKSLVHQAKPEYLLDQFMGKATDKVEHKIEFLFDETDKETAT